MDIKPVSINTNKISFGKVGEFGGQFGRTKSHRVSLRRKQQEYKSSKTNWKNLKHQILNTWRIIKKTIESNFDII